MKLIYCPHCQDIVKLRKQVTICKCGRSFGSYFDDLQATYSGDAIPLGITNSSLIKALKNQPASGDGEEFVTFVIPKECPTFKQLKEVHEATPSPDPFESW